MLARLRHRAVDRAHDQDRAVHLRRAGDHVLDVVGMARAVDVRVVPLRRAVLDVARRDRQDLRVVATSLRLGGLGHLVVRDELRPALVGGHLRERRRQRRLAVIDVADRAHVHVRLGTVELLLRHCSPSPSRDWSGSPSPAQLSLARTALPATHPGADDRNRTGDLVLTKDALCQLSYIGPPSLTLASRAASARQARHPLAHRHAVAPATLDLPAATACRERSRERRARRLERETGIEPATNSLEGCDSTTELLPPSFARSLRSPLRRASPLVAYSPRSARSRSDSLALASRTPLAPSPLATPRSRECEGWWRGKDSNLRSR